MIDMHWSPFGTVALGNVTPSAVVYVLDFVFEHRTAISVTA